MQKRIVFHVPFKLGYALSGGGIRPGKLIRAFEDLGYAVDVVTGDKATRMASMQDIRKHIAKGNRYDFCYAESSVLPTMLTEKGNRPFYPFVDFDFFRFLKEQGTHLGLFYRDIYWKFPYYKQQFAFAERMKRIFFHHLDFHYYSKLLDRLFLPSDKLVYLLPGRLRDIALPCPPGHDQEIEVKRDLPRNTADLSILYVGGISHPVYDITPLMKLGARLPVTVCCRKEEWETYRDYYAPVSENITVCHLSGEELKDAYSRHALSAIVRADHEYLSFASPLKLYEAVGQNIPLLVSEGTNAADFVIENNLGWAVDNEFRVLDTDRIIKEYPEKVSCLLDVKQAHHWRERAVFIRDAIMEA